MRVYLCDLCKKEIHDRVYRINIVAFPSADPPESARALDDDWANEIRKMDLCYDCLTDALRGENDTPEKIEGGYRPHTAASRFRNQSRSLSRQTMTAAS